MKSLKLNMLVLLSLGFFACGGAEKTTELSEDIYKMLDGIGASTEWNKVTSNKDFDIEVPARMKEMEDLNMEASIQYGFIDESIAPVREHYLIVLMETKEEIVSYGLDVEFDAMSYRNISVAALREGLDNYEVLTKDPKVEKVNGMNCVKNEMRGSLGPINVLYKLGVFEGENAFYQVLTWCIEEQKTAFSSDMDRIIDSFVEKN